MKIENEEVSIRIGNKTKTFKNLILNSYLDLFADSFLDFKQKNLPYCLINFTKNNMDIDENSTEMQYDTILEADFASNIEVLTGSNIVNKYFYKDPVAGMDYLEDFEGQTIKELGFANYDYNSNKYILYAFLDVSKYEITIQNSQPVTISRVDKISSDMKFWANNPKLKAPYHLTTRGLIETIGMEYQTTIPKLYSIGFGVLPYSFIEEYLVENLTIQKGETGIINISNNFYNYPKEDLYPRADLYPKEDLYLQTPTANLLIYKFKMYKKVYPNPESDDYELEDTEMYYSQFKKFEKSEYGKINLSIKYERG